MCCFHQKACFVCALPVCVYLKGKCSSTRCSGVSWRNPGGRAVSGRVNHTGWPFGAAWAHRFTGLRWELKAVGRVSFSELSYLGVSGLFMSEAERKGSRVVICSKVSFQSSVLQLDKPLFGL